MVNQISPKSCLGVLDCSLFQEFINKKVIYNSRFLSLVSRGQFLIKLIVIKKKIFIMNTSVVTFIFLTSCLQIALASYNSDMIYAKFTWKEKDLLDQFSSAFL